MKFTGAVPIKIWFVIRSSERFNFGGISNVKVGVIAFRVTIGSVKKMKVRSNNFSENCNLSSNGTEKNIKIFKGNF